MIKVTKVDLHSLNVTRLNEDIDAGWKPVAYVPYGAKVLVFLKMEETHKTVAVDVQLNKDLMLDSIPMEDMSVTIDDVCSGITKAGVACRGARYEDTKYCVAHQDQG